MEAMLFNNYCIPKEAFCQVFLVSLRCQSYHYDAESQDFALLYMPVAASSPISRDD
jgi:hypothetical protein